MTLAGRSPPPHPGTDPMPPIPRPNPARIALTLALGVLATGLFTPGCAPDRRRITPTTLGTDLRRLPGGRMSVQPFPGTDLARRAGSATLDPAATLASGSGRAEGIR